MIFGTDGVRDRVGEGYLSHGSIERIVAAAARTLEDPGRYSEDFPHGRGRTVVVARDTRASGAGICEDVGRGFARYGYCVLDLGVLPTPGAAFIASAWPDTALGVVVSASHNPADYNGIKFLAPTGAKISPDFEKAVSNAFWDVASASAVASPAKPLDRAADAFEAYVRHLVAACKKPERLQGKKIAIDAANGAAYRVAPEVFRRLGLRLDTLGVEPDGRNINHRCGALHPEGLGRRVVQENAALGFSFDGDADRMIPVTASGTALDGDFVLCLAGLSFHRAGRLASRTVVATTMSNLGLELALGAAGIRLLRTDVGDRNVYLEMIAGRHPVGGEQSGHVIFLEDALTGDGVLAAIRLLEVLESDSLDLGAEASVMKRYPQMLRSIHVREKVPLEALPRVQEAVRVAEARLKGQGRIVLRYSGTEPLVRVMIEGPDSRTVEVLTQEVCDAIRQSLPGSE